MMADVLAVALVLGAPQPATVAEATTGGPIVEGRRVTLAQVLEQARARAPEVQRAEAYRELGVAEREAAAPLLPANPSLYLGVGGRTNRFGANIELQTQLSQPVEVAGERRMRLGAAGAYQDALDRRLELARWQAEVEARAAFYLALVERRRAETAALVEEFSRAVVDVTDVLVKAGEESPLRLRLARAELAHARQARQEADRRYRAACVHLAERVGWPPDERLIPRGELPEPRSRERGWKAAVRLGSTDVPEHPAMIAAQAEVEAAAAVTAAARRDAWPHPSVGVYMAREREPGTPIASRVVLATISLPLPLWQRNQAERARARARLRIAGTERALLARTLIRERRRAADALDTAARRLEIYAADVLPRFSESLVLLRRAFELGEIDLLEVFVERERFLRLQDEALDVYVDYIGAARDLELASG